MKQILLLASALITIASVVPYIIDVAKHKTKPRIVSWFVWTVLMVIAGSAALSDGNIPTAVLSLAAATATGLVVIIGYKNSDKTFTRLDIVSFIGACIGLALWWYFDSPLAAIIMSVATDFVGAMPTVWHAYKKPKEETTSTFVLSGIGALLALLAVSEFSFATLLLPIYLVCMNATIALILVTRKQQHRR